MHDREPLIGVTVLPEFFQSESVEGVLDRLQDCGVNAVTTSPYVMEPADPEKGAREPPIDAGAGHVRKLDRELWGHRELWVRTAPSFTPRKELYHGLRYQPAKPDPLTEQSGQVIDEMIGSAEGRGMTVCLQVQAAIPPGYRVQFGGPDDQDKPRMPNGQVPPNRVANNGSLASPEITGYGQALLADLCGRYPSVHAIRVDWPEYPPYSIDDMFVDFSPHAETAAQRLGFDFARMRQDTGQFYDLLHGHLPAGQHDGSPPFDLAHVVQWCCDTPGVLDLLRFKRELVGELLAGYRQVIQQHGQQRIQLAANLFPWPWSLVSGADYQRASAHCSELAIKLYGMHWKMMLRFYSDQLIDANPQVDAPQIVAGLLSLFDFMDSPSSTDRQDYAYPGPAEPHGVSVLAQQRKLQIARRRATTDSAVRALVHGYGPVEDFAVRLRAAFDASPAGIWINRYGYLSNDKLAIVRGML